MTKLIDITGKKFGRLTAVCIDNSQRPKGSTRTYWRFKCDCGNYIVHDMATVRNGNTKSCGCLRKEVTKKRMTTHGLRRHPLYNNWRAIKYRCYNKNAQYYYLYGKRGIKMCNEWKNDFKAFYNWALENGWKGGLTIDRIDVNGNYTPNNCRWATSHEQSVNKRSNHFVSFNNETHTISEWGKITGLGQKIIQSRIKAYGWDIEDALTIPKGERRKKYV